MIHFGRKGLGVIINHESSIISEKLKVEGNVWFQEIFENVLVWPLDSLETSTLNIEIKDLEFHSRSKIFFLIEALSSSNASTINLVLIQYLCGCVDFLYFLFIKDFPPNLSKFDRFSSWYLDFLQILYSDKHVSIKCGSIMIITTFVPEKTTKFRFW